MTLAVIVAAFTFAAVLAWLVESAPPSDPITRFDTARCALRRAADRAIEEAQR